MKTHRGYLPCLRQTTSLLPNNNSTSPGPRLRVHTINHALCCPSWVKSGLVDEAIMGGFAFLGVLKKTSSLGMKPPFWIGPTPLPHLFGSQLPWIEIMEEDGMNVQGLRGPHSLTEPENKAAISIETSCLLQSVLRGIKAKSNESS